MLACVAGCGGDDAGSDDEAIREVVRLSLTTNDPEADCNERLSDGFVERTYGTRPRCERIQGRGENEEGDVESVEFASLEVEGDTARTRIEARGAEIDAVGGVLDLVREDSVWRIDHVGVPLLRTLVDLAVRSTANLPAGGFDCIDHELLTLPDSQFRRFAYQLIGQRPASQRRILQALADCNGRRGVSLLRQAFEEGLVRSLREQGSGQEQIDCILSGARAGVPDDRLLELLSGTESDTATGEALAPAIEACR